MIALEREVHAAPAGARTDGQPLYAIGDVHGCYALLRALLEEIVRDAAARYHGVTPTIILCGDYIDRGPCSSKVMTALVLLERSGAVDARFLDGNHEAMLRMFIEHPERHGKWIDFGGRETLESYGIAVPADSASDATSLVMLRNALLDAMPAAHHRLLNNLEPMVEIGSYAFVHAGIRPGIALKKQVPDDLLWIRDDFLDHPRPSRSVIVHGHTWIGNRPEILGHRIGIDTGAYETGVLTAIRIDDREIEVIRASDHREQDVA
ncbi:metallophosphoesterase [Sphingomonas sp. S1-29]|uniref:metallophosphoesterase n=1 Tax=Sphingomonas sp. S1-29 TaxID=2991074 RepID=UPI00223EB276|nr:metallophosphoesterase [Sphingomonas sp. S1-29]UZK68721.1 metallophosphoesterase [Sphingomonas sp. S1-29]